MTRSHMTNVNRVEILGIRTGAEGINDNKVHQSIFYSNIGRTRTAFPLARQIAICLLRQVKLSNGPPVFVQIQGFFPGYLRQETRGFKLLK